MTPATHFYGLVCDLPDIRDYKFDVASVAQGLVIPEVVDLRSLCPPVYDQGQLGSCTANAVSFALDFMRKKQNEAFISPSRLFIYYNERKDQGTIASDSGASIRESVKTVVANGSCPESEWAYDISQFTVLPNQQCFDDAIKYEALQYQSVNQDVNDLITVLANGDPVLIGISVYESFESQTVAQTGIVPIPAPSEKLLGGHAVAIVGYDKTKSQWIVRNSWGENWGDHGYFYMPFEYLTNPQLSTDFWTLQTVK